MFAHQSRTLELSTVTDTNATPFPFPMLVPFPKLVPFPLLVPFPMIVQPKSKSSSRSEHEPNAVSLLQTGE